MAAPLAIASGVWSAYSTAKFAYEVITFFQDKYVEHQAKEILEHTMGVQQYYACLR